MLKKIKILLMVILVFYIVQVPINIYSENKNDKTFKIGFYDYEPYYFFNNKGKPTGYYVDLLELLKKDTGIEYEYMMLEVSKCLERLETGEIDVLLGLGKTPEREDKFIFTDNYVDVEKFGVYTNKDIDYGKLTDLEGVNFAHIKNEANYQWILNFLEEKNISVNKVEVSNYEEAREKLLDGSVDAIAATITDKKLKAKNKIYEFSTGPVYIAVSKGNEELINKINVALDKYSSLDPNPTEELHNKYFNKLAYIGEDTVLKVKIFIIFLIILLSILLYMNIHPKIKKKIIQKKIRERINNNKYLLYYQPIIDPKRKCVMGLESLLRLKDINGNILTPFLFMNEIEENNMGAEISIWILKQLIKDYKEISRYNCIDNEDIYISFNITTKEMENTEFIKEVIKTIKENNVKRNSICMEIIESVKINDLTKIKESINLLKENGIIIAIDDFGVEYSNLDIIEKIEFDILKLDKYFIDNLEESHFRQEIIKFLSNLLVKLDKSIVAEGVETKTQNNIIKNIQNNKIYIQGYYYSKPLPLEKLRDISKSYCKAK